ncbi:hypothetical protein QYF61_024963, partial [Mycteria americana]
MVARISCSITFPGLKNHRITESYRLEKTFKIIESNHKPNTAKNHHYTMSLSTSSKRPLNTSRDGDSTTSLGSLFQCLITLSSKPPLAQLEAISSCPITCYLGEETDPHLSTTSFQVVEESDEVSPQPPFLQAKQSQLPQPLLIRLLLQTLHQLRCPSLYTLQHLNVPLVVGGPKLNTVFEVRPHQCRVQGHNHFPSPAGHAIFDTGQDAIGFLGRLGTLLAHIQAAVNQHPQVLLCQAAFQPLFPKPVVLHGVAVAQVQDLALGLVKPHTIGLGPSIQPVQVPLQSLPTLQQINTPTQLGVVCKLTESALDPFVQIIDKDVKQNWPQHRALGNTACDRPPTGAPLPIATINQRLSRVARNDKASSHIFPPGLWGLGFLKAGLPNKDGGKEGIEYLSLFHVLCNQVPCPINGPTFSLVFLLSSMYLQKAFSLPLTSLARSSPTLALTFLTTSLHAWTASLYSSQVTCPCFHLL